ncbi:cytochrome p450 79a2 [Striga hermonthica]|uniref:Cytochrome p450 79a2 n=1 Tax=Striga hermonthica TaxID=68872 RepID=A0A9N7RFQ1_STRHE|nr:cytochrome p450 79a2 [Striga hermonthica]
MQENNTEIACIRLGRTHVIPVASPELAREFLRKHDQIFASRPFCMTAKLTSDNYLATVLSPTGHQWKKMRKIMSTKILSPTMHRFLHGKRLQEDDHLVRYAYNQCRESNHGLVNIRAVAQHYCANVTRRMVFGKRFFGPGMEDGGPGKEEIEHVEALFTILKYLYGFSVADYVPWLEVFDFDGYKKFISNAIHNVRKYQDPEIMNRVEMWRQGIKKTEEDILDVLINLKDSENNRILSVQEISAQIIDIMIAAVDNPANAVEWGIAEIINQPHILDKAHEELDQVVGRDRLVQESDLPKLNYIKSCIKESFRLHPVAPFVPPHVSSDDVTVGGYLIPKGSQIMLSRMGLGRNPRVWNDPLEYKPERHIVNVIEKEVVLVDNELNVLSFSTGRRGCPGVVLGSTMSTMLLARLLQSFNFTTPLDGVKVDLSESDGGLQLAKPLVACAEPRLEPHIYLGLI